MANPKLSEQISYLFADFKDYLEVKYRLTRLEATEKLIIIAGTFVAVVILIFLLNIVLLFITLSLAYYLGSLWQSNYLGLLAVGCMIAFFTLIIYLLRRILIIHPIQNGILKLIHKAEKESNET